MADGCQMFLGCLQFTRNGFIKRQTEVRVTPDNAAHFGDRQAAKAGSFGGSRMVCMVASRAQSDVVAGLGEGDDVTAPIDKRPINAHMPCLDLEDILDGISRAEDMLVALKYSCARIHHMFGERALGADGQLYQVRWVGMATCLVGEHGVVSRLVDEKISSLSVRKQHSGIGAITLA